jgi:DNA-directed RNA polymerase subunit M/transcription elongation factor TFIIS
MAMSKKKKKGKRKKAKKRLQKIQLSPIKIKKKHKSCPTCKRYEQWFCTMAGPKEDIPPKVFNSGCKKYRKNKYLYF